MTRKVQGWFLICNDPLMFWHLDLFEDLSSASEFRGTRDRSGTGSRTRHLSVMQCAWTPCYGPRPPAGIPVTNPNDPFWLAEQWAVHPPRILIIVSIIFYQSFLITQPAWISPVFEYSFNPHNAEIFVYKLWRLKGFFQFEIIINVLVSLKSS